MTRTHATPATAPTAGRHPRSAALAPSLPLSLPLRLAISLLAITLLTTGMLVANRAHAADAAQDLVKQGAALYAQNCQYCHQADAIGAAWRAQRDTLVEEGLEAVLQSAG